ncbi:MAG: HAD family hydrolase [Spirochaetia bacterium]|jgi:phosphoglycolate phosphatase|nr:HAD family hydrolase [Spirochaetia bacterium]
MENGTHKIKAVIFDKDGTLYDYAEIWNSIFTLSINEGLAFFGLTATDDIEKGLLSVLGIDSTGKPLSKGIVFNHKKRNIFFRSLFFCIKYRISINTYIKLAHYIYDRCDIHLEKRLQEIDFIQLRQLFSALKQQKYLLGMITQDKKASVDLFLRYMGIADKLDFISTRDDKLPEKPNPKAFHVFCKKFNLSNDEVALVGDSQSDMEFAENAKAGYKIGILWGAGDRKSLEKTCNAIYPDIYGIGKDPVLFPKNMNVDI